MCTRRHTHIHTCLYAYMVAGRSGCRVGAQESSQHVAPFRLTTTTTTTTTTDNTIDNNNNDDTNNEI